MYWSDVFNGSLNRAFLNGTNAEILLRTEDPVIGEIKFCSLCIGIYILWA